MIICLLAPLMLIGVGALLKLSVGQKANDIMGYRTRRSKLNQQTWDEAHKVSSKYYMKYGVGFFFITIIMLIGLRNNLIIAVVIIYTFIIPYMFIPVYFTEKHLKNTFDEKGYLKN
jgi:hypothetical protein